MESETAASQTESHGLSREQYLANRYGFYKGLFFGLLGGLLLGFLIWSARVVAHSPGGVPL